MVVSPDGRTKVKSVSANNLKTLSIINNLATAANILNFDCDQIDVCHRTSDYYFAPIIIKFLKKQDKENFMRQRAKLKDVNVDDLHVDYDLAKLKEWRDGMVRRISGKDWNQEIPRIMLHEHLTEMNNNILKQARTEAYKKGYKFTGYLSGTTICVRKTSESQPVKIECMEDINKIT